MRSKKPGCVSAIAPNLLRAQLDEIGIDVSLVYELNPNNPVAHYSNFWNGV